MNNFEQLQLLDEESYRTEGPNERVRKQLDSSLGTFRFIGLVVDMYFPKMVDTMMVMSGGTGPVESFPDQDIQEDKDHGPSGPSGPGGPGALIS